MSLTVKVTTPFVSEGPLAAEIVELPPFLASVTVLPLTRLLFESLSVTVIVDVVDPSATTEVGLALTVELVALPRPGCVVMFPLVPVKCVGVVLSVAVTVCTVPAIVLVVNETVATPLESVVLVPAENEPPLVLLQVMTLHEVCTGLAPLSVNCAVIVTAEPATGVLLLDVTTYFVAAPGLNVAVTVIALLFRLNLQVVLVLVQVPLVIVAPPATIQPPNVDGALGASVSVTVSVFPKELLQVPLGEPAVSVQVMLPLPPLLVTEPLPVPENATVRDLLSVNVICAVNADVFPVAVNVKYVPRSARSISKWLSVKPPFASAVRLN